ncbi:site-specific integrase [Clostridia bacterium]|nr:site-specific integrase [Clostridia bacterium]
MSKSVTGNVQKKHTKSGVRYYPYVNIKTEGKNKPQYLGCSYTTKREALKKLNEEIMLRNSHPDNAVFNAIMLFSDWVAQWLVEKEAQNKIKAITLNAYKRTAATHIIPHFAGKKMKLSEVGWSEIERYLQEKAKTLCTGSLKCHRVVLSQALNAARKHGYILHSPMLDVELPESKKKSPVVKFVPNVEQFNEILSALESEELYPLIYLTAALGLRRSEVAALKWEVFDERERTLQIRHTIAGGEFRENVTKSGSSRRSCPLDEKLYNLLMQVRSKQTEYELLLGDGYTDEGYIFTRPDGKHYDPDFLTIKFPLLVEKAGFPRMTFHALRKFACSALMNDSVSSAEVAKYVGHSNVTVFYNHNALLDL